MRVNEPSLTEKARWRAPKEYPKRYVDYIRKSEYNGRYKEACIRNYKEFLKENPPVLI